MFIKFIKDYKDYNVNKIICCNEKLADKLVESGYAIYAGQCYRIGDLYVTDTYILGEVVSRYNRERRNGGRRIVYKTEEFVSGLFGGFEPAYIHAITGMKIYDCVNRYGVDRSAGDMINRIDSEAPLSTVFMQGMVRQGLTVDDFIPKKDLIRLENILNGKTNENIK